MPVDLGGTVVIDQDGGEGVRGVVGFTRMPWWRFWAH